MTDGIPDTTRAAAANPDPEQILNRLKLAFGRARDLFFRTLPGEQVADETSRRGDCDIPLDRVLEKLYRRTMVDLGGIVYAEGSPEPLTVTETAPLIFILDPLDGTVNALSGMRCGVSVAFGAITGDTFRIGDIQGVLVGDYLSGKIFSWREGGEPTITPSLYLPGELKTPTPCRLFEIPDPLAYSSDAVGSREREQGWLLEAFHEVFPRCQRRAVDCTSLQMLEPLDGNLTAYGDLRQQARIWDTIPSIRFTLAVGEPWLAVDQGWRPYSCDDMVFNRRSSGDLISNIELGRSVVTGRRGDIERIADLYRGNRQPGDGTEER